MSNVENAKARFLSAGGSLQHKNVQRILAESDARARREAESRSAPPNQKAAELIVRALGWLSVVFFYVVLLFGVAALLIVIPAAEFVAVYEGMHTITDAQWIVFLTTAALFIGTIVLMFLKHVYEDRLPNGKPRTSIMRPISSFIAHMGISRARNWHDTGTRNKLESDYIMLSGALNLAKLAILGSSLIGRLRVPIQAHMDKPVGDALASIRDTLTGEQLIGVIVSLIILSALLLLLDVGVLFVYTSFRNTAGNLQLAEVKPVDFLEVYSELKEKYQTDVLTDLALQLETRKTVNSSGELSS
jgi:hypothetical protein